MVGQVNDRSLIMALNSGMRFVHEIFQSLRKPMVAARLPAPTIHALLHDRPTSHHLSRQNREGKDQTRLEPPRCLPSPRGG
jgi:hypothetical protein